MESTVRIDGFAQGMDNRRPDFALAISSEEGGGSLLRDAVNVDVQAQGSVKTRAGYELVESGLNCHSGWSPLSGAFGLYVDSGDIYRLDVDAQGKTSRMQIAAGYGRATSVVFTQVNEAVYFTDGLRVGSYHPVPSDLTPRWLDAQPHKVGDVQFSAMPPGSCIAHHGARLLVAVGQYLCYSEPFTPHLRDESRGFIPFPAEITCLAVVDGGVFVVADQTYFLVGGVPAQAVRAVLPYGAPRQMAGYTSDGAAHWMSERGLVRASSAGEVVNVQERHIAMKTSGAAATLYREADGAKTIVAALSQPENSASAVGSYAQMRLVKKDSV